MLDIARYISDLDQGTRKAKARVAVKVAGKKVELATTNPLRDTAVENLKEAQELLKRSVLEHTPLFKAESSYILKCFTGDEIFPCTSSDVCGLCHKPERPKEGLIPRGHHLGDDPAVWVCDRFGHPKVVGCRCPKCTTEQGCKYFYYWEPGSGFPVIGKEKQKNIWIPATSGYDKGVRVVGNGKHKELVHYSIPKLLPVGMYEEVPPETDIGTCRECLYFDNRLQCPAHVAGEGYWVLKRHYPKHLEWAIAEYKPEWKGKLAPMLLPHREHLTDSRRATVEQLLLDIDLRLQRERLRVTMEAPIPNTTKKDLTTCSLDDHLTAAVRTVSEEWKKVVGNISRTGVQGDIEVKK